MKARLPAVLLLVLGATLLPAAAAPDPTGDPRVGPAGVALVPGTVAVAPAVEEAVLAALVEAGEAAGGASYYAISDLQSQGAWRWVSAVGLDQVGPDGRWTLEGAVWAGLLLLRQEAGGGWTGAAAGTAAFSALLAQVPETLIDAQARADLDPLTRSPIPAETYDFPWEPGTQMQYGVLGVHDAGFIAGWKAVDFFSDADLAAGHAPNRLLAAAPGTISYVCDDHTSVAIRIGDLLYVHLLDNADLVVGHSFDRGEELGQLRPGNFSDVCGWASQGSNWFHLHWGFPNTGTFEAGGWTLDLFDELWRRGGESRGTLSWFEAEALNPDPELDGSTQRVSVSSDGSQGNGASYGPALSPDGRYVAFFSQADNLVPDDANGYYDLFVRDRELGETERVSLATDGSQGDGESKRPSISADGRYVVFESLASNLVLSDTNGQEDIFIHDRQTGQTQRLSVASDGTQGNNRSWWPHISADGRFVTFDSYASNLIPGDTNHTRDVFLHDRGSGETARVSVASDGGQGDGLSRWGAPSADGSVIVFSSQASNLVPVDENEADDIFIHDRISGQTVRISLGPGGVEGNGDSYAPQISADGRYVVFDSSASNLVAGDGNTAVDVFLYDRQAGTMELISVASDGGQGDDDSRWPFVSDDGRYVSFTSWAANLVPGDDNDTWDVFLRDRHLETTERVSVAGEGDQGNGDSGGGAGTFDAYSPVAAGGRTVAFQSAASNLVAYDSNDAWDLFTRDRGDPVLNDARIDLGMPYDTDRGCPSTEAGCGGPFHGFYFGVCTDLVIDAYRYSLPFDLAAAVRADFKREPHGYWWGGARNVHDLYTYFQRSGQWLPHAEAYQPGDAAFFQWASGSWHVGVVTEVDDDGRPLSLVHAPGCELACTALELAWNDTFEGASQGHGRLSASGAQAGPALVLSQTLLISVDHPVDLRLYDANGKVAGEGFDEEWIASNVQAYIPYLPGSRYGSAGSRSLITVTQPLSNTADYTLQLTAFGAGDYHLGIQTFHGGSLTALTTFTETIGVSETHGISLTLSAPGGVISFSASAPAAAPRMAFLSEEIRLGGLTGTTAAVTVTITEAGGALPLEQVSVALSGLENQMGRVLAGGLFSVSPAAFDLPAGAQQEVRLEIDLGELLPGLYQGALMVGSADGGTRSVSLSLFIEPLRAYLPLLMSQEP